MIFIPGVVVLLTVLIRTAVVGAAERSEFDAFVRERRNGIENQSTGFKNFMVINEKEYEAWRAEETRQYENFKREVKSRWGEYLESTRRCFVHYSEDLKVLQVMDFERGEVKVEVLSDSGDLPGALEEKLSNAVKEVVTIRAADTGVPLLAEQVKAGDLDNIAGKAISHTTVSNQKKLSVTFPMVPDHIRKRAFRYYPLVKKNCEKYDLAVSHVMATIHMESLFNPMARSVDNALGLMQIMPETGGREAYNFVYGKDAIPSPSILYNPEKNIELGCAYIHLLKSRHFGAVNDHSSNLYCSIAGYNTGPGNVAFAFTGKRELTGAIKVINEMKSSQKVYGRLIGYLPFYETRVYLKNVIDAMRIYK